MYELQISYPVAQLYSPSLSVSDSGKNQLSRRLWCADLCYKLEAPTGAKARKKAHKGTLISYICNWNIRACNACLKVPTCRLHAVIPTPE
jgi:hypothetical protein